MVEVLHVELYSFPFQTNQKVELCDCAPLHLAVASLKLIRLKSVFERVSAKVITSCYVIYYLSFLPSQLYIFLQKPTAEMAFSEKTLCCTANGDDSLCLPGVCFPCPAALTHSALD